MSAPHRNIRLTIAYDGTDFHGWQTQPAVRTVQETLTDAVEQITRQRPYVIASGRTDTGVHAEAQVVNFHTSCTLPTAKLLAALNGVLPKDIAVRACDEVDVDFHATHDAKTKRYRYRIFSDPIRPVFDRHRVYHCPWPLNVDDMRAARRVLIGRHDFRCFETEWPNRKTSVRTIYELQIARQGLEIQVEVEADGFLYNMVRAIMGTLIEIGRGKWPVGRMAEVMARQDRRGAGPTAPACGLSLIRVTY